MIKPKYRIGDRILGTELKVFGVKVLSTGSIRYWLFAGDNGIIADENEIELLTAVAQNTTITYG